YSHRNRRTGDAGRSGGDEIMSTATTTAKAITFDYIALDAVVCLIPDNQRAARLKAAHERNCANETLGLVGVYHAAGWLVLSYKGRTERHRGGAVQGCDYTDEFVQHLASKFKAEVDACPPKQTKPPPVPT